MAETTIDSIVLDVKSAVQTYEKKGEEIKTLVLESVGDLSGALLTLVNTVAAEIKEIPEVATILRYVPKFVAFAHTLTVPGSEKKTLVMKGLHGLTQVLAKQDIITDALRGEIDTFIDSVVPISIDTTLDVVKGRVTFASIAQSVASNPQAIASVVETSIRCCSGFLCRGIKKGTFDAAASTLTNTIQTAASIAVSTTNKSTEIASETISKTEVV